METRLSMKAQYTTRSFFQCRLRHDYPLSEHAHGRDKRPADGIRFDA